MMKSVVRQLGLVAAFAAIAWSGGTATAFGAEEERGAPTDRLERLERRVNEMAQRQEQLMRRLEPPQERPGSPALPGQDGMRPPMPLPGSENMRQPPPAIPPAPAAPAVAAAPQPAKAIAGLLKLCFLVCFIFNILIAVWIFTDIRKRGEGSGIFIALALLAGVPAAIIYALVRIGDKKTEPAR
jgi:hypothetical protein